MSHLVCFERKKQALSVSILQELQYVRTRAREQCLTSLRFWNFKWHVCSLGLAFDEWHLHPYIAYASVQRYLFKIYAYIIENDPMLGFCAFDLYLSLSVSLTCQPKKKKKSRISKKSKINISNNRFQPNTRIICVKLKYIHLKNSNTYLANFARKK